MSELVLSFSRPEDPEVISLNFPDVTSRGTRRYPMRTPRSEWVALATRKAQELGIEFRYQETGQGLDVAFLTQSDASNLLAAIQPEWQEAMLSGLTYWARVTFRQCVIDGIDPTTSIEEMAAEYAIDAEELLSRVSYDVPLQAYDR